MHRAFKDWHLHIKLFLTFFLFTSHQISLGKGFHNQLGKASCSSRIDSVSCTDLKGVGSLNNTCLIRSDLNLNNDICIYGNGNIEIFQHVSIICPIKGCSITINVSGSVKIGAYAQVIAGSIIIDATNVTLNQRSTLNTTSLGGPPPSQTSGTPSGVDGAGGGHGGRGASCLKSNKTNWGGDVYAWATLADPWSYGSKGGSMSVQSKNSGDGGGRVMVNVEDSLLVDGYIGADGGESAQKAGGGSGGSIIVRALKL